MQINAAEAGTPARNTFLLVCFLSHASPQNSEPEKALSRNAASSRLTAVLIIPFSSRYAEAKPTNVACTLQ